MSVVPMEKIHLVSVNEYKDIILQTLKNNEVIDIQTIKQSDTANNEISQLDYQLAEIKSTLTFLEKIEQKKKSFIESFIPATEEVSLAELNQPYDYQGFIKKIEELESRLTNLNNLKNELHTEQTKLLPWQTLSAPLDTLVCTANTCLSLGSIKNKELIKLRTALAKISAATELTIVNQTKANAYIILIYLQADNNKVTELLNKTSFNQINLPKSNRTPAEEMGQIETVLSNTDKDISKIMADAKKLCAKLRQLRVSHDYLLEKKASLEIKQKFTDTDYAFIIEGWIKQADFDRLKNALAQKTNAFEIIKIKPGKDEKPPVVLKNSAFLAPFELITKIYGTPKYNEIDPTVALSFFFALFFGLCLGDFGYGLALALASVYFLKRYKLPIGGQNLFKLLMLGGLVSVVVGALTGSYLGFNPKDIPAAWLPLKQTLLSIQIIDPIKSPLIMLGFSLALGVVQLLFGIMLQMYWNIRSKLYVAAILDDGLWLVFLSSIVYLLVANTIQHPSAAIASKLTMFGAIAMILTQGRHKKGLIPKLLSGLLSLYKLSGYMGDTLSYSRLLALGMSSAIIGSVINILAGMVKGGVPVLGVILMIVLMIFGHLFNLIISTLGAFVHSTRLQMVEFFSKFYEGGGRQFKPYKRVAEYTILK